MREIIERYFACWLDRDADALNTIFSEDIVYTESYGPEYTGREQVIRWFREWQEKGSVLQWDIRQFIEQDHRIAVEWYFVYEYQGNRDAMDGITLAVFDENNRICSLKEFQSKAEHCHPYGNGI